MIFLKAVYVHEKRKLTKWKIKRIAKKIDKIQKNENVAIAISKNLSQNEGLLQEFENRNFTVLTRSMVI